MKNPYRVLQYEISDSEGNTHYKITHVASVEDYDWWVGETIKNKDNIFEGLE